MSMADVKALPWHERRNLTFYLNVEFGEAEEERVMVDDVGALGITTGTV